MATTTEKLLTADEFAALGDIGPADLVRGKVVYLTRPKPRHGRVANNIATAITEFVKPRKLGQVYGSEIGYIVEVNPDTVRSPDVSFVRGEVANAHDEDEWYPHSPDLAVEVLSPSDRPGEVEEKVQMWLDGGGRLVWVVDPARRTAAVHRIDGSIESFTGDQELRDDSVLTGFSIPLLSIFD